MIVNVNQAITIHSLRVGSLSNSSILQIGSAGMIKGLSNNFNTGGFTGPAPQAVPPGAPLTPFSGSSSRIPTGNSSGTPSEAAAGSVFPLIPLPALH